MGKSGDRQAAGIIALLFGLYAAQGTLGSMVQTALPTVLRDEGARLDTLGYLHLLFLPWALKFLWAPFVDRFYIAEIGRRRSWILVCQISIIAAFALMAFLSPIGQLPLLLTILAIAIIFGATQDTATDALAVEALRRDRHMLGGSAQVAGGYFGFIVGIGVWLAVFAHAGWTWAMLLMVACLGVMTMPTVLSGRMVSDAPSPDAPAPVSLLASLGRPELRLAIVLVLVYQFGGRLGIALTGPFLVDAGLPLDTIGWLRGGAGAAVGIAGAVFAGAVFRRLSTGSALCICALLHALSFAALSAIALTRHFDETAIILACLAQAAAFSLTFAVLYSAMMGWCLPERAGTDFALLQSADALLAIVAGVLAGLVSEGLGHGTNFALAALFLFFAAFAAPLLTARIAGPQRVPEPISSTA
ncbi:MFS transporter (putative signal transducer) [Parvibaculum indicum]|uniref:MFS transporter n=1 Tax=Parvibaculum indicum TaxID=562969 RepID=UPI001423EB00|nr:MFS transporter [Parvibaculum indicum]NIJ43012.1 MFS transporter (putative signal transducer) [Parvibaculum indicum]